jgi:hypothetical protein
MILFNANLTLKELFINIILNVVVWTIAFVFAFALTGLVLNLWGAELIELQNFLGSGKTT